MDSKLSRLLYLTETMAISETDIKKIARCGKYWDIWFNNGSFQQIWDEKRTKISQLFDPIESE